jgi:glycosyltransferase involved in cell wall biosynthesis
MAMYLNAADIYISTSLSDGTSCSLLEAMACRLPVVVTDLPAIREWVKDDVNGYLVPSENSAALAERIVTLLGNEPLRDQMGTRNLVIAQERADWERNFSILEEIYRGLVNSN